MLRTGLAALMLCSAVACAQPCGDWLRGVGTPGLPPGTTLVDVFEDPANGTIYAASSNRIFQLISGEWEPIAELGLAFTSITQVFVVGGVVYCTAWYDSGFPDNVTEARVYRLEFGFFQLQGSESTSLGTVAVSGGTAYVVGEGRIHRVTASGVSEMASPGDVRALAFMNRELYAGGTFNNASGRFVSKWTGSSWVPVGTPSLGPNAFVTGLYAFRPDGSASSERLIVAGEFSACGTTPTNRVAEYRQDGTWAALAGGISQPAGSSNTSWSFETLPVGISDTDLIVGTSMTSGTLAGQLLRWTGSAWQTYGTPNGPVEGLGYDGGIIAGGSFSQISGFSTPGIAKRVGASWTVTGTGTDGAVRDLLVHDGVLYACGDFTQIEGVPANRVAYRDATGWHPMGTGMNGVVRGFVVNNGVVHAFGDFTTAGGSGLIGIAQWNGSIWNAPWSPVNVGQVEDACVWNGSLVVCGSLTQQVGRRISRLSGNSWTSIPADTGAVVTSVESYLGSLYAAGLFDRVSGNILTAQRNIARWSGSEWEYVGPNSLSNGVDGRVNDLQVYGGFLYAGGQFTEASGVPCFGLARWNGSTFSAVPGVSSTSPLVTGLHDRGGRLYVTGSFRVCPLGEPCSSLGVAAWDGIDWQRFAGEDEFGFISGSPYAAAEFEGRLFVGGEFGERYAVGASYLARWSPDIVMEYPPQPREVCAGGEAAMSITMAFNAQYTYQWMKGNVTLSDGGRVSGAQSSVLRISDAQFGDTGSYSCRVTNDCGTFESPAATLVVRSGPSITPVSPPVVTVSEGAVAGLTYVLGSTSPATVAWYHNDFPVAAGAGGASAGGGVVSGQTGPALQISGVRGSDAGVYFATVANACGDATGASFVLVVQPGCTWGGTGCFADYDGSGGVDSDDVIAFFGEWDSGELCADVDGSGGTDSDDVIGFFTAWDAGGVGYPGC